MGYTSAERCTVSDCLCDPMPSTDRSVDIPGTNDGEATDDDDSSLSSGS